MEFPLLVDIVVDDDFDTLVFPRLAEGAEPPPSTDPEAVPIPAPGTELVGEFRGSGLTQVTYLARTASGQVVQLSRLLWLVLSGVDGSRTLGEVAARVSVEFGRTVSAGNVEYLLDNKLIPLGLVAGGEEQGPASPGTQHAALLSLRLRATVIPEAGVQVVARLFGPLFLPPVVAVVLASLTAADVWLVRSGGLLAAFRDVLDQPLLLLVLVGLSVVSMVFHECGHATACRYGGARPGRIGMGLYVLWPAMFTNVTDSYRLGRGGRIRTDLGGVYFNAVFAVVLAGAYLKTGYLPLAAAALLTQIELAQQLLPSLRLDGYFILTDLVGVPDLFREIRPVLRSLIPGQPADPRLGALRRTARIALTAWVAVIVPLLSGEFVLLLLGLPQLATTFARSITAQASGLTAQFGRGEVATGLASVLSLVLLAFPAIGMCYVMLQTLRMLTRAAVAATRKRPLLRIPVGAVALAAAAGLATYWGVLPLPSHHPAPAAQPAAGPSPSLSPVLAVIPAASSTSPPWPSAVLARHAGPPSADGTRAPARRHHRAHRPRRVTPAETPVSQPVYPVLPSPTPSPSAKPTKSAKPSQSAKPTKSPSPSKSPTASKSPSPSASASASATVTPSSGPS
jgi:putative peptide zinc metalloprotease protein